MTLLDVSIVNVALPSLQRELGASSTELSWVVSGYALTFGVVLVSSGRLGDDYGRKRMLLIALALFTLTSATAGLAPTALALVIIRLLQGAAAGMLSPQVTGLIQQLFSGSERGRAFGMFGATVGVSTAIGPLLGGLLLEAGSTGSWRYIFWINVPIGLVALVLGLRLLPRDETSGRRQPLDVVGSVLLGGAVVTLMLPLVFAEQGPASVPWWLFGVCALFLAGFVAWERRAIRTHGQPLVDFAMLRIRSYAFGSALIVLYFAGFTSIFFVLSIYFQQGKGYSALATGLVGTPFAVGSGAASAVGGRLVPRFGRPLVVWGLVLVIVGLTATVVVLLLDPAHVGWFTAAPLLVAGVGSGLVIAPNQTLTLSEIPPAEGGTAAGVFQTGQRIGTAIGISAAGAVFFGQLAGSGGDYSTAVGISLIVTLVFVALALVVGLVDVRLGRRGGGTASGQGT
ncbi:MAG: MFS transporter [Pseudonocardia sp.]|nr:MFS transporter [Pseudonocardia sp.]